MYSRLVLCRVFLWLKTCWSTNIFQGYFSGTGVYAQKTKFMGPTWGPPGSCRPQMAPYWPHESCYQGGQVNHVDQSKLMIWGNRVLVCVIYCKLKLNRCVPVYVWWRSRSGPLWLICRDAFTVFSPYFHYIKVTSYDTSWCLKSLATRLFV